MTPDGHHLPTQLWPYIIYIDQMSGISLLAWPEIFMRWLINIYYILVPFHKMKVLEMLVIKVDLEFKDTNQKALLSLILIYIYLRICSLIWSF